MSENKKSTRNKWIIGVVVLIILVVIGRYAYAKYTSSPSYQQEKAVAEQKTLVASVSKLMVLPEEEPAIFIVQDPNQLVSQQLFFKGAEKGDKLMIFQKAGKAVLYSESRNMIINVGPVTFDQAAQANTNPSLQKDTQSNTTPTEAPKRR